MLFWLRQEIKPGERRCVITPNIAKKLIIGGHKIIVERNSGEKTRCFDDTDYETVGCTLVEAETNGWETKAPQHAIIVGLKELPYSLTSGEQSEDALIHDHIFFCHAYKNQSGWREQLQRFINGGGKLYDLEYLTDDNGKRIAAFGYTAGVVGAAVSLKAYYHIIQRFYSDDERKEKKLQLNAWDDTNHMIAELQKLRDIKQAGTKQIHDIKVLVIGANGRCGSGAVDIFEKLKCHLTKWTKNDTQNCNAGPFPNILTDYDILVNCIYLDQSSTSSYGGIPFLTKELIDSAVINNTKRLKVICDVSCDVSNPKNPLPFINTCTTISDPLLHITDDLVAISIDHLPTLLPKESSESFSSLLFPLLLEFPDGQVWQRALNIFNEKVEQIKQESNYLFISLQVH